MARQNVEGSTTLNDACSFKTMVEFVKNLAFDAFSQAGGLVQVANQK
jgi:hypothetical protein